MDFSSGCNHYYGTRKGCDAPKTFTFVATKWQVSREFVVQLWLTARQTHGHTQDARDKMQIGDVQVRCM